MVSESWWLALSSHKDNSFLLCKYVQLFLWCDVTFIFCFLFIFPCCYWYNGTNCDIHKLQIMRHSKNHKNVQSIIIYYFVSQCILWQRQLVENFNYNLVMGFNALSLNGQIFVRHWIWATHVHSTVSTVAAKAIMSFLNTLLLLCVAQDQEYWHCWVCNMLHHCINPSYRSLWQITQGGLK